VVRRDLMRYYAVLADEQAATDTMVARLFLPDSLEALRAVCAGVSFETAKQVETLWAFGVGAWGEDDLRTRALRSASLATLWAVVDALESGVAEPAATVPPAVEPEVVEVADG